MCIRDRPYKMCYLCVRIFTALIRCLGEFHTQATEGGVCFFQWQGFLTVKTLTVSIRIIMPLEKTWSHKDTGVRLQLEHLFILEMYYVYIHVTSCLFYISAVYFAFIWYIHVPLEIRPCWVEFIHQGTHTVLWIPYTSAYSHSAYLLDRNLQRGWHGYKGRCGGHH